MPDTILVGTEGGMVALSVSGERHAVPALAGRSVGPVTASNDAWLAVVDRREIWSGRATDADLLLSWDHDPITCVAPRRGGFVVGTAGAHVAYGTADGLAVDSYFDALPEREKWYTPWGAPPDTRSIATLGDDVFANIHVGGVAARYDSGPWRALVDIDVDVHQVIAPLPEVVVVATGAAGLGVSPDGGATWTWRSDGMHSTYARAVAVSGDTVIVTASTGPFTKDAAVYRAPLFDDAAAFERCENGLPHRFGDNLDTHTLAANDDLVALVTPDGDLYTSLDEGSTWARAADGLVSPRGVAITT
jgi:hypothetical protein